MSSPAETYGIGTAVLCLMLAWMLPVASIAALIAGCLWLFGLMPASAAVAVTAKPPVPAVPEFATCTFVRPTCKPQLEPPRVADLVPYRRGKCRSPVPERFFVLDHCASDRVLLRMLRQQRLQVVTAYQLGLHKCSDRDLL